MNTKVYDNPQNKIHKFFVLVISLVMLVCFACDEGEVIGDTMTKENPSYNTGVGIWCAIDPEDKMCK